ncbi:MAG: hypothetical protein FJ135_17160 [Deltaproteobacteria bacterium]|nr:hypothetical protein [Deltaproteobacteria bacterium]
MADRTATLANLDRSEYGTITLDLDLLRRQITWLAGLSYRPPEGEGILNLLEGIQDLADPLEEEAQDG